ncbi:hypothetical protein B0H14DRAFT_2894766 [Mycena olivaceomarginata]|nr:hypothetical protein B0H14DRAFT_2894766 [Mycena olivaceomarginata]
MVNSCPTCGFKSFTPTILLPPNKTTHIRELLQITRLRAILGAVESERATLLAEHAALQAHYDDCQGLSLRSPVKRLPVETLLAIFWMCSKPFPPTKSISHAHAPLFAVSQVCASTIDFPQGVWEDLHPEKMMTLLKTVIERGAGSALHVVLPPRGAASTKAVDVLVKHSQRWKTATFTGRFSGLERLSKGRFPVLESLELHLVEIQMVAPATGDFFHVAPKLKRLVISEPHLQQLQTLECIGVTLHKVTSALSSMAGLSSGTTCRLVLQLVWSGSQPPTLSNVGTLSIEFPQPSCAPDVTDILANLTLPCLENLTFRSDYFSRLPWPHADFLALSSRFLLTELQRLEISDDHRDGVEPIINNFLSRVSLSNQISRPSFPHLRHLVFRRSRLQFDDNVFLSFLLSRVSRRLDDSVSVSGFEVDVSRLRGLTARIRELCAQNLLLWTFA